MFGYHMKNRPSPGSSQGRPAKQCRWRARTHAHPRAPTPRRASASRWVHREDQLYLDDNDGDESSTVGPRERPELCMGFAVGRRVGSTTHHPTCRLRSRGAASTIPSPPTKRQSAAVMARLMRMRASPFGLANVQLIDRLLTRNGSLSVYSLYMSFESETTLL
jgi:hypothetical protein